MNNVKTYIESGILEMYVLGVTTSKENAEVAGMAVLYLSIQNEIEKISAALYNYLKLFYTEPPPAAIKINLLALIKDVKPT